MRVDYSPRALDNLESAPTAVRKIFFQKVKFLASNLQHPSLHAKKYDEGRRIWQARVNKDWRFYFQIIGETYLIIAIIPHPK